MLLGWEEKKREGIHTNLRIDELSQRADELWCCVYVDLGVEAFFLDVFADGVPEGGFEALLESVLHLRIIRCMSYLLLLGGGIIRSHTCS